MDVPIGDPKPGINPGMRYHSLTTFSRVRKPTGVLSLSGIIPHYSVNLQFLHIYDYSEPFAHVAQKERQSLWGPNIAPKGSWGPPSSFPIKGDFPFPLYVSRGSTLGTWQFFHWPIQTHVKDVQFQPVGALINGGISPNAGDNGVLIKRIRLGQLSQRWPPRFNPKYFGGPRRGPNTQFKSSGAFPFVFEGSILFVSNISPPKPGDLFWGQHHLGSTSTI